MGGGHDGMLLLTMLRNNCARKVGRCQWSYHIDVRERLPTISHGQ